MADRDLYPFDQRINPDNESFRINRELPNGNMENSVGCLSVNPLGAFGARSKNDNSFDNQFDMYGMPKRSALESIDNSFDNDPFFGLSKPVGDQNPFVSPMNQSSRKKSGFITDQQFNVQSMIPSNNGGNNGFQINQYNPNHAAFNKPLTEQEIQQQSTQHMKQYKRRELNCGCGPTFQCALHQGSKSLINSKIYDQFGINDKYTRNNSISNNHQYNSMNPQYFNSQNKNIIGQQQYTQEQIQQAAYTHGKHIRPTHLQNQTNVLQNQTMMQHQVTSRFTNFEQQQNLMQPQMQQYQQQNYPNMIHQQRQNQQLSIQNDSSQFQLVQKQEQDMQSQMKAQNINQTSYQKGASFSASLGKFNIKVNNLNDRQRPSGHISIPCQIQPEELPNNTNQEQKPTIKSLIDKNNDNYDSKQIQFKGQEQGSKKQLTLSIDLAQKPIPSSQVHQSLNIRQVKVQENPKVQSNDQKRVATITIPNHTVIKRPSLAQNAILTEIKQKQSSRIDLNQIKSRDGSNNFSNHADSQVSSIQNSYDDMVSANSNKADLGNKRKADIAQSNSSKENNEINLDEKKPGMIIVDQSITSSKHPENLVVSFNLAQQKNKAFLQSLPQQNNDTRKDVAESFKTQSFAGKSKNSKMVTIPFGDQTQNAMGSQDQNKDPPKPTQKVSINLGKSEQKPSAKAEIRIPSVNANIDLSKQQNLENKLQQTNVTFNKQNNNGLGEVQQSIHLNKTGLSKVNLAQQNSSFQEINGLRTLLPQMLYQQTNQMTSNMIPSNIQDQKAMLRSQSTDDWKKQLTNNQNIQNHNTNFASYKIDQGPNAAFFEKPETQRINRFNLGVQKQSVLKDNNLKDFQKQSNSMRPLDQMQMNNQVSGVPKFDDLDINLQNDIRDKVANAAAQAAQSNKFTPNQQKQFKMLQKQQESQSKAQRNRPEQQSSRQQTQNQQNGESMTGNKGVTGNTTNVVSNEIKAGGNYDASSHHNISIGNFIKQDVIVNIHMGNPNIENNKVKQDQAKQDIEGPNISGTPSGEINSGNNTSTQQQNVQRIDSKHAESSQSNPIKDEVSQSNSKEARSTLAIASDQQDHEMTMSIASYSRHQNSQVKLNHQSIVQQAVVPPQDRLKLLSRHCTSDVQHSGQASSMQAQPGSSNTNSQQTDQGLQLINTFQQVMNRPYGQDLQLQLEQLPQNHLNFNNLENLLPQIPRNSLINFQNNLYYNQFEQEFKLNNVQKQVVQDFQKQITISTEQPNTSLLPQKVPLIDPIQNQGLTQILPQLIKNEHKEIVDEVDKEKEKGKSSGRGKSRTRGSKTNVQGRGGKSMITYANDQLVNQKNQIEQPPIISQNKLTQDFVIGLNDKFQLQGLPNFQKIPDLEKQIAEGNKFLGQISQICQIKQVQQKCMQRLETVKDQETDIVIKQDDQKETKILDDQHAELKLETNNTQLLKEFQNINEQFDQKVQEEINQSQIYDQQFKNNLKQDKIGQINQEGSENDDKVQQMEQSNENLNEQVQELFQCFQENLVHIINLHKQINSALDLSDQTSKHPLTSQDKNSKLQHQDKLNYQLRLMKVQIENIQKIAKETEKFHEFFQQAHIGQPLNTNQKTQSDANEMSASESINNDQSINLQGQSNHDDPDLSIGNVGQEKLQELEARGQSLTQKKLIIEQQLESIQNQQKQTTTNVKEEKPNQLKETNISLPDEMNIKLQASRKVTKEISEQLLRESGDQSKVKANLKKLSQINSEKQEKKQRKGRKKKELGSSNNMHQTLLQQQLINEQSLQENEIQINKFQKLKDDQNQKDNLFNKLNVVENKMQNDQNSSQTSQKADLKDQFITNQKYKLALLPSNQQNLEDGLITGQSKDISPKQIFMCTKVRPMIFENCKTLDDQKQDVSYLVANNQGPQISQNVNDNTYLNTNQQKNQQLSSFDQSNKRNFTISLPLKQTQLDDQLNKRNLKLQEKTQLQYDKVLNSVQTPIQQMTQQPKLENSVLTLSPQNQTQSQLFNLNNMKVPIRMDTKKSCLLSIDLKVAPQIPSGNMNFSSNLEIPQFQNQQNLLNQLAAITNTNKSLFTSINTDQSKEIIVDENKPNEEPPKRLEEDTKQKKQTKPKDKNYLLKELEGFGYQQSPVQQDTDQKRSLRSSRRKKTEETKNQLIKQDTTKVVENKNEQNGDESKKTKRGRKKDQSTKKSAKKAKETEVIEKKDDQKEIKNEVTLDWTPLVETNGMFTKNKRQTKQELKNIENVGLQNQQVIEPSKDVNVQQTPKGNKRARLVSKEAIQPMVEQKDNQLDTNADKQINPNTIVKQQDQDKSIVNQSDLQSKVIVKPQLNASQTRANLRATAQRNLSNGLQTLSQVGGEQIAQTGQYNLVPCEPYASFESQPYRIYFTFEVQMLMYIHSYLSKNEVIGLLGGKFYNANECIKGTNEPIRYLIVSKIYPAESCTQQPPARLKNCEISDEQQIQIQEQMEKDGVVKLAWYHSHPIFEVDPSMLDLQTHQKQQSQFDRQGLPFFGVIIGPYHTKQGISETLFKVFHLKEDKTQNKHRTVKMNLHGRGKALQHKIIPNTKLKYSMYQDIKQMIRIGSTHQHDKPDLAQEWGVRRNKTKYTNQEKFMRSLEKVCDENLQLQSEFDVEKEIRNHLQSNEDRLALDSQLFKTHEPPLSIVLNQIEGANGEAEGGVDNNQLQRQADIEQNLQSRTFFSISESKKISKYLFKIEQCLIKNFGIKTQALMEETYKTLQQQQNNQSTVEKQQQPQKEGE